MTKKVEYEIPPNSTNTEHWDLFEMYDDYDDLAELPRRETIRKPIERKVVDNNDEI